MKKRFLALIVCACTLIGVMASASGSASQDNTLVSRSYLEGTYFQDLAAMISGRINSAVKEAYSASLQTLETLGQSYVDQLKPKEGSGVDDWLTASGFVVQGGEKDDTVTLAVGAGFILTSGIADFSGVLVDLTSGTEVKTGTLIVGHRYVAAEESFITIRSGAAYWSVEGQWLTTSDGVTEPPISFTDVPRESLFYDAVCYVVERGLFVGTSETAFSPYVTINRGMMATILHRLAGEPEAAYAPVFSDVPDGQWYTPGVIWAAESTVVIGMGDGTYRPTEDLTHQQVALMFYNYANWVGVDTSARADLSTVCDGSSVASWAKDAVSWAVATGIMEGDAETKLTPKDPANRAQVAMMLQRFDGLIHQ